MTEKKLKVLCVEDEADIRVITKLALEAGEFEVETCASGTEAIEKVGSFRPDLILLDVMMPGMDGPATLKALREALPEMQVPVIFMTAKASASEVIRYKSLGAVDVIVKPFDPMTLASTVKATWEDVGE